MTSGPLLTTVSVATSYVAAAELARHGLRFSDDAALLWIASAVALAALVLRGREAIAGIALGILVCVALGDTAWIQALVSGFATLARIVLTWWILVHVLRFDSRLERAKDMLALIVMGSCVMPLLGLLCALGVAFVVGHANVPELTGMQQIVALGEAVGTLLLLPAILTWAQIPAARSGPRATESIGAVALACAVSVTVFSGLLAPAMSAESLPYALFPFTFWAALRLGMRTTATMLLLVGAVAVTFHSIGLGPFVLTRIAPASPMAHFASLYLFLAVLSVTSLLAAVAQRESNRAQAQVRDSEQRYRALIEGMNEGVNITDPDARMTFVSDRFCEMTGYRREELLGRTGQMLAIPEQHAAWTESHRQRRAGLAQSHALVLRRKNGEILHVWISPRPRFDATGRYLGSLNVILDVTDRRRAEERAREHLDQLAHVARVASMGEMASAIAHEINQPLTAIANYASASLRLLKAGKLPQADAVEALQRLAAEAERAGAIVRKMRGFVRGEEGRPEPIEVADLFADVLRLCTAEARQHDVELETEPGAGLACVHIDAIQIQQVLLNLVRNAVEAMSTAQTARRKVVLSTHPAADMIEIRVRDTGPGLAPDAHERVFEPFYTTKADGLGIGLALSRSIVDAHGGRLWVTHGEPGAIFHLTLPIAQETQDADA